MKAPGSRVDPASAVCHLLDLLCWHVWAAWLPTGLLAKTSQLLTLIQSADAYIITKGIIKGI